MKNDFLTMIEQADTIAITGHVRPDGDCVGSTVGLYNYIISNYDKQVQIYLEEFSKDFLFLHDADKISHTPTDQVYDLCIAVDCGDKERQGDFLPIFERAKRTMCVDHHISNPGFGEVCYVDEEACSAAEALYKLMEQDKINKNAAEALYMGIVHDTGVFKYSCTSRRTMDIAGKMMEMGIDYSDIIDNSFYKKSYIQNQILGRALLESVLFYDGRCIFSSVSIEEMNFYGVTGKELGGIIEQLRLTDGVEVAIFLYETDKDEYKVSLRSKKMIDVARIAADFGGGGHVRAAGFSAKGNVHSIVNKIGEMIEQQYNEDNA